MDGTATHELWAEGKGGSWWQRMCADTYGACAQRACELEGRSVTFEETAHGVLRAEGFARRYFVYELAEPAAKAGEGPLHAPC